MPDLVDAIVDVTETGSSLKANKLRIVDTLLTSFPHFYANGPRAGRPVEAGEDGADRDAADRRLGRPRHGGAQDEPAGGPAWPRCLANLPSLRRPTVSHLSEPGWVAVETVIDEKIVRDMIPDLKRHGAEGIIEYSLNKIVP